MRAGLFAVLAAATFTVAAPTPELEEAAIYAAPALTSRQDGFSTTWSDDIIPQPQNFQVRNAGAACDFQIAYERFQVDNRYDVQYYAVYPDGSSTQVQGLGGGMARDSMWLVDGYADDRAAQVVFFPNICKSGGVAPNRFRVNFSLKSGFTYSNRWTTGIFDILSGSLPGAPADVRVTAASKSSTVTWTPMSGVTGYIVMVEWYVSSEVGPYPFIWAREVTGASSTSFSYNRRFNRATVIGLNGGTIAGGAKQFTPLDDIKDYFPS